MNRSHDEIAGLLPGFARGTLLPGEQELVAQHVMTCESCRSEAALLGDLLELEVPEPGERFWKTLPSEARKQGRQSRPARALWTRTAAAFIAQLFQPVPVAAVAALAVLFFVVSTGMQQAGHDPGFRDPLVASVIDYDDLDEDDLPAAAVDFPGEEGYQPQGRFSSGSYAREFASMDAEELAVLEQMLMMKGKQGG